MYVAYVATICQEHICASIHSHHNPQNQGTAQNVSTAAEDVMHDSIIVAFASSVFSKPLFVLFASPYRSTIMTFEKSKRTLI